MILWWLATIAFGGVGTLLRVAASAVIGPRVPGGEQTAIGLINVVGAGVAGVVAARIAGPAALMLGAGLLGGMTTFSTWMVAVDHVFSRGERVNAAARLLVPLLLGFAACVGAYRLA